MPTIKFDAAGNGSLQCPTADCPKAVKLGVTAELRTCYSRSVNAHTGRVDEQPCSHFEGAEPKQQGQVITMEITCKYPQSASWVG